MKNIINIVNFIRAYEPRFPVDLIGCVKKQIEFSEKYGFKTTFMPQYDSLLIDEIRNLMLGLDDKYELGSWIEFNRPLTDKAGIKWKGNPDWVWDWHTQVGFTPGYTEEERYKLVDIQFDQFKEIFGYYPKSIGSWVLDAKTIEYCEKKYGIVACVICKDQYGTDGYTYWGGYFNQAYYPSKKNSYLPAQNIENQINVPMFKMLGSDPLYQYDCFMEKRNSDVISLEPACEKGGGDKDWCEWFFETNFKNDCLGFAYAQTGQENCFGWNRMEKGFEVQFQLIDKYVKEGLISVEKVCESGKWFKENFKTTPVTTIQVNKDFENRGNKAYWYESKNYRLNLKIHKGELIIRDIHKFQEDYEEFCLNTNIDTPECKFNGLPIFDQVMSFVNKSFSHFKINSPLLLDYEYILNKDKNTATIKQGDFKLTCYENEIEIYQKEGVEIEIKNPMYIYDVTCNELKLFYEGFKYSVKIDCDFIEYKDRKIVIKGENVRLIFN